MKEDTDIPDHSAPDDAREHQPQRRLRPAMIAATLTAAVVAFGAVAVIGGTDGEAGEPRPLSAHDGMVTGTVWVANEDGGSLTAIDAATSQVLTTVTGIAGPHNVQVSPDGRGIWAVSGHAAVVAMLDSAELTLHGTVRTGAAPAHVVVTPDGSTAYTTNGGDGTITAIDAATMEQVATIPTGAGPHGLRPSPDGRWIYVANVAGTTLSVIDSRTNTKVDDIAVGRAPAQVAFSPDGRFVYASLNGEDAVAKVDVARRRLVGKVDVGDGPVQTYVTPDDRFLLVANQGTHQRPGTTVSVIDTESFTVDRTVETGRGAHGIVVDPSGRHAYVTNLYGNDVAVMDLDTLRVVARVPVGDKPNGISFSAVRVEDPRPTRVQLPVAEASAPDGHADGEGHDTEGH